MAFNVQRDRAGASYEVTQDGPCAPVSLWWERDPTKRQNEVILIRQETPGAEYADVLAITHGQAYDLIACLCKAIEDY